jgi:hypothetical protein
LRRKSIKIFADIADFFSSLIPRSFFAAFFLPDVPLLDIGALTDLCHLAKGARRSVHQG